MCVHVKYNKIHGLVKENLEKIKNGIDRRDKIRYSLNRKMI